MSKLKSPKILLSVAAFVVVIVAFFLIFPPVVLPPVVIPPERVFGPFIDTKLFGLPFTLSITNTILASWVTMIFLVALSLLTTKNIRGRDLSREPHSALVPASRLQCLAEYVIEGFYGLVESVAGKNWARRFFPVVFTFFIFIIVSNWMGILPFYGSIGWKEHPHEGTGYEFQGPIMTTKKVEATSSQAGHEASSENEGYVVVPFLRSAATDLNTTLALAIVSVLMTQYFGVRALGLRYFTRFVDFTGFREGFMNGIIGLFVGVLEIFAELAKIISFSFRLFGNIFAGEVLLGVMAFLVPYVASLPFYGLELFVGFVQALVFMMLSLVFFTVAIMGHGPHEGEQ